jgi:hypothetical protein
MKFLKALSLSFALGVLALLMLGAGGKGNVMPATKSGRMGGDHLVAAPVDAGPADAGKKPSKVFMPSTKSPGAMHHFNSEPAEQFGGLTE